MQICPVLTLSGPVRRTKKATGKRVTHCSYADCSQTPCKHDSPRLGFIMQSQDKLSYLGKASQSSSNKKPIRLEWLFFIEVAYFVPEIHCTQSLLYLQGTTFYRYRWLLVLQINKQRPTLELVLSSFSHFLRLLTRRKLLHQIANDIFNLSETGKQRDYLLH